MRELTVKKAATKGGFNFHRSDGKRFFSVYKDNGSAVVFAAPIIDRLLYAGADRENPPQINIVDIASNVQDKVGECIRWVLAYPSHPPH